MRDYPYNGCEGVCVECGGLSAIDTVMIRRGLVARDRYWFTVRVMVKVPVRSNFPKFIFVDFSKVYVAVTHQAKPFFNPSTRSPFCFHGISRILRPLLIGHVPTAQ